MSAQYDSKAYETVQNFINEKYAAHTIRPGDCIYETALAEELGLSRTPVRDALGRLVANGLLEQLTGKRGYRIPSLDFNDMRNAFEAREFLDEKIGALAAQKAQSHDLSLLNQYNEEEIKAFNEGREMCYIRANDSFHLYLAKVAGNPYIERIYAPVYWRTQLYVYYLGPFREEEKEIFKMEDYESDTPHEHASIIEAITARDSAETAKRCLEHAKSTFSNRLSKQFSISPELFQRLLRQKYPNGRNLVE